MSAEDLLRITLKNNGYSLTASRQSVFAALSDGKPLLMRDLVKKTASQTNRASVYRTIEIFEQLGIVIRLQHGWKYRLELSDLFTPHHHHLTCSRCGASVAFDEPVAFETIVQTIAKQAGYVAQSHQLEIAGLCGACAIRTPDQKTDE